MPLVPIASSDDPRIAAFRNIRERDLTGREGRFVAEGAVVVRQLVSTVSLCRTEALLLAETRVGALSDVIASLPDTPVFVAGQAVLDAIAGFHLHRGVLALGVKPAPVAAVDLLARLRERATVLVAAGIGNHDNMGGLYRAAAAFGADAVLLDDRACDPFYRKAIRVSVGAVLRLPAPTPLPLPDLIEALHEAGFDLVALTPSGAEPLHEAERGARLAVVIGSEGPGLPPEIIARCRPVAIPMSGGFDSLNAATAGAIALHHFTHATAG